MDKQTKVLVATWVGGVILFCMLYLLRNFMSGTDGLTRIWVIGISAITAFLCFRYMMTD
jgi:hypothetical protein